MGEGKDNWKEEREADLTVIESGEGKEEREKKGKEGRRRRSSQRGRRGESTSTTGRRKAGKKMYSLQEKEQGKKKEEGKKELRYHQ